MAVLLIALLSPLFLNRPSEPVQITRPYTSFAEKSEAEQKAGLALTCPDTWHDCTVSEYRVYTAGMLEAVYMNAENETVLTVRKAKGSDDISGDYNTYAEETVIRKDEFVITARGDNGLCHVMAWTADGYSYSVSVSAGISPEEADLLIDSIR